MIVIGIALAANDGARLARVEYEGAGAHHVLLVPALILVEDRLRIDEIVRRRQQRDEAARRIFQLEDDGLVVGRRDALDHAELSLAGAVARILGKDDALERGFDVLGRERRAVVELDALPNLEGVDLP